jgi:hypothetical protein
MAAYLKFLADSEDENVHSSICTEVTREPTEGDDEHSSLSDEDQTHENESRITVPPTPKGPMTRSRAAKRTGGVYFRSLGKVGSCLSSD